MGGKGWEGTPQGSACSGIACGACSSVGERVQHAAAGIDVLPLFRVLLHRALLAVMKQYMPSAAALQAPSRGFAASGVDAAVPLSEEQVEVRLAEDAAGVARA
jgi:hypothetical protein